MADLTFQPYDPAIYINQGLFYGDGYAYSVRNSNGSSAIIRNKDGTHWIETGGYGVSLYSMLLGVQGDILYSIDRRNEYTLLFSKDLGVSWNSVPFPSKNRDISYSVIPVSNCVYIWYSVKDTLYVSKDNGVSWQDTGLKNIYRILPTQRGTYVQATDLRTIYFSSDGLNWKRLPDPPLSGELYFGSGDEVSFYAPDHKDVMLWVNEVLEWVVLALPEILISDGVGYGHGLYPINQGLLLWRLTGESNNPENPAYFYFQDSSKMAAAILSDKYVDGAPAFSLNNLLLLTTGCLSLDFQVKRFPFWQDLSLTVELIGS